MRYIALLLAISTSVWAAEPEKPVINPPPAARDWADLADRKSTRLNSSHLVISYAVFCLKKKNRLHVLSGGSIDRGHGYPDHPDGQGRSLIRPSVHRYGRRRATAGLHSPGAGH